MSYATPTRPIPAPPIALPATPESRSSLSFSSPPFGTAWTPNAGGVWTPSEPNSSPPRFPLATPSSLELTPDVSIHHHQTHQSVQHRSSSLDSGKRGRPRADHITHLILEGTSSPSGIKCRVCNRVFPREKSLQAHLRTHTGERPYVCDYPGCSRAFTQSGQLKTHQRLHAGEKPFVCSSPGCGNRYTHANRTCPAHPYHKPQRSAELVLQPNISAGENPNEVNRWLENYRRERIDKTPGKTNGPNEEPTSSPLSSMGSSAAVIQAAHELCKRSKTKRGLATELEQENLVATSFASSSPCTPAKRALPLSPMNASRYTLPKSPLRPCAAAATSLTGEDRPVPSVRRTLGDITPGRENSNILPPEPLLLVKSTPPGSPVKTLKPKKRWLKTVFQEQKKQEKHEDENLAMPIRWNDNEMPLALRRRSPVNWSVVSALVEMGQEDHRNSILSQNSQPLNLSTSASRRS